jgi:hypothetical protein
LVTSSSKRKYEDEQYLRNVQQIALSKEGKIFDTRSISTISSHTRRVSTTRLENPLQTDVSHVCREEGGS